MGAIAAGVNPVDAFAVGWTFTGCILSIILMLGFALLAARSANPKDHSLYSFYSACCALLSIVLAFIFRGLAWAS